MAGPQAPVLSVLQTAAVKLKLYVPEFALSSLSVGARLTVRCDGCGDGMRATVSYISSDPEFTAAGDLLAGDPAEAGVSHRGASR